MEDKYLQPIYMFRTRYIIVFSLLALLFFSGCKNRVPRGFPKPDKMADIITELHILESTLQYGPDNQISTKESYGYYKNVLAKYGYTYEQFDSIRIWYANNVELYQKVYDRVIVNLSRRETEFGLILDKEKEELKAKLDSTLLTEIDKSELWRQSDSIFIYPTDTVDKLVPFNINTDTLELTGKLRLSAKYKFLNNDESKNPQMMLSAFYADSTADTLYLDIPHSFQKKIAVLDLLLDENKKATCLNGYLLWQDSLLKSSVEISAISLKIINDSINKERLLKIERAVEVKEAPVEQNQLPDEARKRLKSRLR